MTGAYVNEVWRNAVKIGKDAVIVVDFGNGMRAECHLTMRPVS